MIPQNEVSQTTIVTIPYTIVAIPFTLSLEATREQGVHKQAKPNDERRSFGVLMTPLSR